VNNIATAESLRPPPRSAAYLTDGVDMIPVLRVLRDHSVEIDLRLHGVETVYHARVLDLDDNRYLLRDIRPRDGVGLLRKGTRFTFSARMEGLYICGEDSEILAVESERGLPYFKASLPQRLLRQQRRRHTRVQLPPRVSPLDGVIDINRGQSNSAVRGRIIDISVAGCRAEVAGAIVPGLEIGEAVAGCMLRLSASLVLQAEAAIRHQSWDPARRVTTVGVELTEMGVTERRRLEQYVQLLSRGRTSA